MLQDFANKLDGAAYLKKNMNEWLDERMILWLFTGAQNRVILGLRQQMKRMKRERRAPEIAFWLFYSLKEEPKETLTCILDLMGVRLHLWLFYGPGNNPSQCRLLSGILAESFPLAKPDSISFPSVLKLLVVYFCA